MYLTFTYDIIVLFFHYDIDRRELLNIRPFEQRNILSIDPRQAVPTYTCCHLLYSLQVENEFSYS